MPTAPLTVHIFFDYVCPWCFVTDLALERLAERYLLLIPKAFLLWPGGLGHLPPAASETLRVRAHAADAHAVTVAGEWLGIEGVSLRPWGWGRWRRTSGPSSPPRAGG